MNYIENSGKTELVLDVQSGWYEGLKVHFQDAESKDKKVLELTQSRVSIPADQIDAEICFVVIAIDNQVIKQFSLTTLNDSDPLSWIINK